MAGPGPKAHQTLERKILGIPPGLPMRATSFYFSRSLSFPVLSIHSILIQGDRLHLGLIGGDCKSGIHINGTYLPKSCSALTKFNATQDDKEWIL